MKFLFSFWIFLTSMIGMGIILSLTTCKKGEEIKATFPVLDTKTPTDITSNSAVVGGFISSDGGATITERGICYSSVTQNPSVGDMVISGGNGTLSFQCTLPNLDSETTYYAKAYSLNSAGIGYGNTVSFTTEVAFIVPVAAFTASTVDGPRPLLVSFTDQSTNNPVSWYWDFGDGDNSTEQNPVHTYNKVGSYTVLLTVTNDAGSDIEIKNSHIKVTGATGTLTDIDGNVYQTIEIGTQTWMAENLKVTHYRNGNAIPNVTYYDDWWKGTTGAYCWYDNIFAWKKFYGALYNWYAVTDTSGLCPAGWHIPTDEEWTILTDYLGGDILAGGKMKSTRKEPDVHPKWDSPNIGATNESGFSGLPGGYRDRDGSFRGIGARGYFWSPKEGSSYPAWYRSLDYSYSNLTRNEGSKWEGFSVRCLRD